MGPLVNISGWIIKDGEDQLNIIIPDGATISDGSFYVIKRTSSDITPYDFSTAFSGGLSNAGEKLILVDATGVTKQTLDFSLGWPDPIMTSENTMQWNGLSWVTAIATPKAQNSIITQDSGSNSGITISTSPTQNTTQTKTVEIPKIKTKILAKTLVFVGIPIEFSANTTGYSNELLNYGKYFWNFGDGDSKETKANDTAKFFHTFFYEGEYTVALEYYQNYYSENPDASSEMTIKVVPVNISISNVGDEKDFFCGNLQ